MDNRLEIRKRIRSDAVDLVTKVVNTSIEYKQELLALETDNKKLRRKNQHLKKLLEKSTDINNFLTEELEMKNEKIGKLLSLSLCYNCSHSLDCDNGITCFYCDKNVCNCCIKYCDQQTCLNRICDSCYSTHPKCDKHL